MPYSFVFMRCTIPLALIAALAACSGAPPLADAAYAPAPPLPDAPTYRVVPAASEVRLLVYRSGPLARFGHNHVITAPVHGVIHAADTAAGSGFLLEIRVDEFEVDPARARREEGDGFAAEVSDQARAATHGNLLGENLLDAARHPRITIESLELSGPRWNPSVRARVTLRGIARELEFPAAVFFDDKRLEVVATFPLHQSAFGIEPFSALGGALRVDDRLDVRVRLIAQAVQG